MRFVNEESAPEERLRYLSFGGVGMLAAIPAVGAVLIPKGIPINWTYEVTCIAVVISVGSWIAVKLIVGSREGGAEITPMMAFMAISSLILATGLGDVAAAGRSAFLQPLFMLEGIFLACIGDLVMQALGWTVLMATVWWSSWAEGIHGGTFAVLMVFVGSVSFLCQGMTTFAITHLIRRAGLRLSMNAVLDAVANVGSLEEGLEICLPKLKSVLPSNHVVAYLRPSDGKDFSPIFTWPKEGPDDEGLTKLEPFKLAAMSQHAVIDDSHCFIPGGQTLSGTLMLAVFMKKSRRRSVGYLEEAADAIGSSLMRLSGKTWIESGLKSEVETDPLTQLPNRRALEARLSMEVEHCSDDGEGLCVAMLDIDHFKRYNDEYGHQTGDNLLRSVAAAMVDIVRDSDLVTRFGGEEFCVVMPGTHLEAGERLMDSLRLSTHGPADLPQVTLSIGVAEWDRAEDIGKLLNRADAALYGAKESGRNRVVCSTFD